MTKLELERETRSQIRTILVTVPTEDTAVSLAKALVGEQLVACVNIVPGVRSIYRWQGKIEDEKELLLILKTQSERVDDVVARVGELHPYTVPEVIALPVLSGNPKYLDWVVEETSKVQG